MKYIFYFLLSWLLYKVIFRFIIPVYKTARQMQHNVKDFQSKMQQNINGNDPLRATDSRFGGKKTKSSSKDYIEFEEVQ